jgi:hypothetical protein
MGIFTWTDARLKSPQCDERGDYRYKDMINYSGYAKVVCPDDSTIQETCYNGYGRFGKYDIYELVAEWNREDILELYNKYKDDDDLFRTIGNVKEIFESFQKGMSDEAVQEVVDKLVADENVPGYIKSEWKRNLGLLIACEHNEELKYPIKITKETKDVRYSDLYPSISCQ